jgi:hypothetical protein
MRVAAGGRRVDAWRIIIVKDETPAWHRLWFEIGVSEQNRSDN